LSSDDRFQLLGLDNVTFVRHGVVLSMSWAIGVDLRQRTLPAILMAWSSAAARVMLTQEHPPSVAGIVRLWIAVSRSEADFPRGS
jgi:hypothetical protein